MPETMRRAAVGFAPHSGWAAVVVLSGDPRAPQVVARERIEMADPKLPGAPQPYHAVEGLSVPKAEERLARYRQTAQARAYEAIQALVLGLRKQGLQPQATGIIDSSGRRGSSLEAILASHALIHTADGEHFRHALAAASARCGLAVTRVPLKQLAPRAARALRQPETKLQEAVKSMGRSVGPPWGADQKGAALIAWMLLDEDGEAHPPAG